MVVRAAGADGAVIAVDRVACLIGRYFRTFWGEYGMGREGERGKREIGLGKRGKSYRCRLDSCRFSVRPS